MPTYAKNSQTPHFNNIHKTYKFITKKFTAVQLLSCNIETTAKSKINAICWLVIPFSSRPSYNCVSVFQSRKQLFCNTHTQHTIVLLLFWILFGTTQVSRYQKGKTNLDLLEQEIVSGSGICWAICKSAPHPRKPCQHPTTQFLQAGCPSCCLTNSVKALKATVIHQYSYILIRWVTNEQVKQITMKSTWLHAGLVCETKFHSPRLQLA